MNGLDQIFIHGLDLDGYHTQKTKRGCGRMTHVWLCGFIREREKEKEDKELFVLINVVVYIILKNCM